MKDIRNALPHRYPFLLVDRITLLTDREIRGIKNVTYNEEYFQGHFPTTPIMPGVLIIEGMAQCAGVYIAENTEAATTKIPLFASIERARFHHPVIPGDQIEYHMTLISQKLNVFKFSGEAHVSRTRVCSAQLTTILIEKSRLKTATQT